MVESTAPQQQDKPEKVEKKAQLVLSEEDKKRMEMIAARANQIQTAMPISTEDADQREARQDLEDKVEEEQPINYTRLGSEECPCTEDDEHLEYSMTYRIPKLENLDKCTKLLTLSLRKNLIKKIEGLENLRQLEYLELYDNRIRRIEGLENCTNLRELDVSFNRIREIKGLDTLTNLKKIYLSANRIRVIENLDALVNIEVLDVGDNKIRKVQNIGHMEKMTELHLAKNKLIAIENIETLKNLTVIAAQANFIQNLSGLENQTLLEELYLQQNQVKKIEGLHNNPKLNIIDLAVNKVEKFENLDHLEDLEELWMNWNLVEANDENREYLTKLKLKVIYLADNPISDTDEYEQFLRSALPTLEKIDGNVLRPGNKFYHQRTQNLLPKKVELSENSTSALKQPNPEAQKILQEVLNQQNNK